MSRPRSLILLISLLSASASLGCEGDPQGLEWGVRFDTESDRTAARYVEASIFEGGCDGREVYRTEVPLVPGASVAMPPNLAPGLHGFAGRARDESCNWYVAACLEETLPADMPVIVTLSATSNSPACPIAECSAGQCSSDDAGTADAAMDAAPDAPPMDSATDGAMDSGTDSGPGDSGPTDSGRDSGPRDSGVVDTGVVDLQVDPRNCGSVGNVCAATEYCSGGICGCRPGLDTLMSGGCTDLSRDPNHCGSEGNVCDTGSERSCRSDTCEDSCNPGQTDCSMACIDIANDPRHCGGCDTPCSVDEVCVSGTCRGYQGHSACTSCPCGACEGSRPCCNYGGVTICVDGGTGCPA